MKKIINEYKKHGEITYIYANNGGLTIIDSDDYEKVKKYSWRIRLGYATTEYQINKIRHLVFLHRLINNTPDNLFTDHINRKKLDNRKCNLRNCTKQQNAFNSPYRSDSSSGIKGIDYAKREKRWRVRIRMNGKDIGLGYYKTKTEAIEARINGMKKYFGEFNPSCMGGEIYE